MTTNKTKADVTELPNLTNHERLTLSNMMLRMQVEQGFIDKYELQIAMRQSRLASLEEELNRWNKQYAKKLAQSDINISNVHIDAETGKVILVNDKVLQMVSGEK